MAKVCVEAPTRIDLAGGTLDINPLFHLLDKPCTVNIGITLNASVELEAVHGGEFSFQSLDQDLSISGSFQQLTQSGPLPLFSLLLDEFWHERWPALSIQSSCQSPAGAGLGGSSCLAVALAYGMSALAEKLDLTPMPDEKSLVHRVQSIETRLIQCPTGCQDYWGGVRGRVNILKFGTKGLDIETLDPKDTEELSKRLIICYSGKSRASGMNNWSIFKEVFDGNEDLKAKLNQIGALARDLGDAMRDQNWQHVIQLSQREWATRKSLWPQIESPETSAIDRAVCSAGADFSRVCGAGGGGVMAIFTSPEKRAQVIAAAEKAGGQVLDASISHLGVRLKSED